MIGWLRGTVVRRRGATELVVAVGGVGYEVLVPGRTHGDARLGDELELQVSTRVRDDAIVLYGFETELELATFELLVATPGIGPATALAALGQLSPEEFAAAVAGGDVAALARVPGIGKKTASRLVLELTDKLPSVEAAPPPPNVGDDLVVALRQLGYGAAEIKEALAGVDLPADDEGALRVALRQLGRR